MLPPSRIRTIFSLLSSPSPSMRSSFFHTHVSPTVHWTITGSTPMSGVYNSRQAFLDATISVLGDDVLTEELRIGVVRVMAMSVDEGEAGSSGTGGGTWATVEMRSIDAVCKDGMVYDMRYCWVVRFSGEKGKEEVIEEVTAYIDTDLLTRAMRQNPKKG